MDEETKGDPIYSLESKDKAVAWTGELDLTGSNIDVMFDDKPELMLQGISFKQGMGPYDKKIEGSMIYIVFNESQFNRLKKMGGFDAKMTAKNEYGAECEMTIKGIQFTGIQSGAAVDDICVSEVFNFEAESIDHWKMTKKPDNARS